MSPSVTSLILKAIEANGEAVLSAEDVAAWPKGDFEEAVRTGLLEKTGPAEEVVCPGCEVSCHEAVEFIRGANPKDTRAYVVCGQRDDIGRVAIPLATLDRWAVNAKKAEALRPPPKRAGKGGRKPKTKPDRNDRYIISLDKTGELTRKVLSNVWFDNSDEMKKHWRTRQGFERCVRRCRERGWVGRPLDNNRQKLPAD